MKNKKCSGTRGYACGKSCISVKKMCRRDGLTGQSVLIMNNFEEQIIDRQNNKKLPVFDLLGDINTFDTGDDVDDLHFDIYSIDRESDEDIFESLGVKSSEKTKEALEAYTGQFSSQIKKYDANLFDADKLKEINSTLASKSISDLSQLKQTLKEFMDKAPNLPDNTEIFSGFKSDMINAYQVESLDIGDEFSFPSFTSFSTKKGIAASYNGGGMFRIKNKKAAKSVAAFSEYAYENEVLVSKEAKYRLVSKEVIKIQGKESTVYNLEELD